MLIKLKKAQNTLEYAVLIAVVAGALIGMQTYMKRAYQGNLQASADDLGEQFSVDGLESLHYNFSSNSNTTEAFDTGKTTSTLNSAETSHRFFNVTLSGFDAETWNKTGQ